MKRYFSDTNRILSLIYEDQPISPQADRPVLVIPERIKAVRSLAKGALAWRQTREAVFVHQARMLEDYEEDYDHLEMGPAWQPTYESLNDEQLQGYLGWRSKVRKGTLLRAPQGFAFLYLYELINLIGVNSPEEGFFRITDFTDQYGTLDPSILPYAEQWLVDFVLYYELDPQLLAGRQAVRCDNALAVLLEAARKTQMRQQSVKNGNADCPMQSVKLGTSGRSMQDVKLETLDRTQQNTGNQTISSDICNAMMVLSGMQKEQLSACRKNEALFRRTAEKTFSGMGEYYDRHRKQSFMEAYVGTEVNKPARLFAGAVFFDTKVKRRPEAFDKCFEYTRAGIPGSCGSERPERRGSWAGVSENRRPKDPGERALQQCFDVPLSPLTTYHCEMGKWAVRTYPSTYPNRSFTELLQTVDAVLRELEGEAAAKMEGLQTKWIRKLVKSRAEESLKELADEEARRIVIDLRALAQIREDAEQTKEKLITEDDLEVKAGPAANDDPEGKAGPAAKTDPSKKDDLQGNEEWNRFPKEKSCLNVDFLRTQKNKNESNEAETKPENERAAVRPETEPEEAGLLSETERAVLACLLKNEIITNDLLHGEILSVILDSINEKLFDVFGDIVVEDGTPPALIEDYKEKLAGLIRHKQEG